MSNPGEARLDKWLWAARIFKTRSIAADACKNGRVAINGAQAKASRTVKTGDEISVRKPPVTYTFRIKQAIEKRVGAKLLPDILENITPPEQYEMLEITNTTRRVYLYADKSPASRPWAQWRPLGRSGDVIKDNNGSIWTISAVIEDFTNEGWICVMATLQPTGIRMIVEPIEYTEGGENAGN